MATVTAASERRHARHLDGPVERRVIRLKALEVRAVARAVNVQQRDHEPRPLVVAADAARGLDVLGSGLRLTENDHQPEARDVESDRDHVRGERHVDVLVRVEGQPQSVLRGSDRGG
jgi:hypothetical protein